MPKKGKRTAAQKRESNDLEKSYRKMTGGKYQKKRKKGQKASALLTIFIAILVIGLVIAGGLYIYKDQTGVFPAGITVAGVDVGGMTQSEAIQAISNATKDTFPTTPMLVTVLDEQISIDPATSKVSLNIRKAISAAFKSSKAGKSVDITPYLSVDKTAIMDAIAELGSIYSSTLSQSTCEVSGTAPDLELVINIGTPEYGLDMNLLYQDILVAYCNNQFTVEGVCEIIDPKDIDLQAILDKHYVAPQNAYINKETGEFVPGVAGYGFDIESVKKAIADAEYNSVVRVPFAAMGSAFTDILGSYAATDTASDVDRNTNLRLACEAINNTQIQPGETFSFNDIVGEPTEAKGYRPALSYIDKAETIVTGGGISQVASALYYCAMTADLEIVERSAQDFAVSYVPLGMDAAVNWGSQNLRFKNTTDHAIQIVAVAAGDTTYVMLAGTDDKDYYIQLRYEVIATYASDVVYETHFPDNAEGYQHGDIIINPHTGYVVKTYRDKHSKDTKSRIETAEETTSNYAKQDKVVCKIAGSEPETTTPGIGNGGVTEDGSLPD